LFYLQKISISSLGRPDLGRLAGVDMRRVEFVKAVAADRIGGGPAP
jgi:hypothetical protein